MLDRTTGVPYRVKRSALLFLLALLAASASPAAAFRSSVDELAARLNAADVEQRRKTMREIARDQPHNRSAEILPLLIRGLSDPDASVRRSAVAIVARISALENIFPDALIPLRDSGKLRRKVFGVMEDRDSKVRHGAVEALVYTYGSSAEIESLLLRRWREEKDTLVRVRLLEAMAVARFSSPPVRRAVFEALDDPAEGVQTTAALVLGQWKPPPQEALPKLMAVIERDDERWDRKTNYLNTIMAYGAAAGAYLPVLERLLEKERAVADRYPYPNTMRGSYRIGLENAVRTAGGR